MSIEELLDILKYGNLSEIDTDDASMEVESVISQLRELNAALYEANRKNDEMTRAAERLNQDCATVGRTPGPWFCGRALRGGQECVIGDGDSVVCFMPDSTIGCTFIRDNARLIAAAPELLDACRGFVEEYGLRCGPADGLAPAAEQAPVVAAAMRAIAKATGEQP